MLKENLLFKIYLKSDFIITLIKNGAEGREVFLYKLVSDQIKNTCLLLQILNNIMFNNILVIQ
jgi:hypothetical protein